MDSDVFGEPAGQEDASNKPARCSPVDQYDRVYLVVVIYDLVDNKRRYRLNKILEGYGVRVQKSAFECILVKAQYEKMLREIVPFINITEDSLRVYKLPPGVETRYWGISGVTEEDHFVVL